MNNGNLLSSLLGATGANSAAGKTAPAKNRPETGFDSSEKFRNVLEQTRPEVAAPKPVARKPSPEVARKAESRPPVDDARAEVPRETNVGANRKTEKPLNEKKAAEHQGASESRQADVESPDVDKGDKEETAVVGVQSEARTTGHAEENPAVTEADFLLEPLSPEALAEGDTTIISDTTPVVMEEGVVSANVEEANFEENGLVIADAAMIPTADPLMATPPRVFDSELEAGLSAMSGADASVAEPTKGADGVELQVAPVLTPVPATAVRTEISSTTAAVPQGAVTNPLAALVNQLGQESAITESLVPVASDTPADVDALDNPDLFILSGKAAFSKLIDSSVSADKTTPIVDTAKPTLTATSLAEPLVRLSEAQSPAARSFVVQTGVPVTVGQPQWSQAVGEKVLWLAAQNVSSAEIRLDPPDLGTMHVKVSVNQDQASVSFTSPHPVVREALDQQLNRLREMFSEQGLNLVNVDVSDQSFSRQRDDEQGNSGGSAGEAEDEELMPVATSTIVSARLVDHYA